ncbi:MAG: hypothetical protein VW684_09115 [Betaproteobacteria bacterium]
MSDPKIMLSEFLSSEEFKARTDLSLDELDSVDLREATNDALTDCLRVLVKEFAKDSEANLKIAKSINLEIQRLNRL